MREDWVKCTFDDITSNLKRGPFGGDLKKEMFVAKGYKVYEQQHAINNNFSLGKYYINEEHFNNLKACEASPGDYIVSCSGTLGKIARLPMNSQKGIINQALLRIRIEEKIIEHNFFLFFFRSSLFQQKILSDTRGSGIQNMAGIKEIKPIKITIPPLPEQRAIVKKIETLFSSLDAGIADLKKSQEQLKIYRQAVLKKAFEGELTKNRKRQNIERIKLKEVLTISSQKHKPEKKEILFYVGLEHIEKHTGKLINSVKFESITTIKNKFFPNQILYGKLRPYLNKVYLSKEEGVCSTDILVFNISEKINPKFIHLFMMGREFVNNMSNNTSGVNLPRVPTKYIENYLIPFTSLEEQQQIVKEVESRLSICDDAEKQIKNSLNQAEALRQSILKKAFEGDLLTQEELKACKAESDYEPASVLLKRIKADKEAHKPVKKISKKKVS